MVNWGDVPGWINALATVGALLAAALAGVAAWRLLAIERRRDKELTASQERAQATQIAAWPWERDSWGATVRNASDLPVYHLEIQFEPTIPRAGWLHPTIRRYIVPPGTAEFGLDEMALPPPPIEPDGMPVLTEDDEVALPESYRIELRFRDAGGRRWRRDSSGVLSQLE